jgi:heavy metal translocating P-type ATPase
MKEESIVPYRYIAILASVGIALFLIFDFLIPSLKPFADYPLYVVLLLGGGPLIFMLLRKMIHLEFSSDLLAGISIATSVVLEQYLAGSLVVLMLSGGQALETYAIGTASKVLEKLAKRAPTTAHRKKEDTLETIPVEQINIGDTLVIFPHEICPVDGEVAEGRGVMDESYLTGEPFFLSKAPGSGVISGSINGDEALTIRANKRAIDSRYAKIMEVMRESEQKRPRMRRLADQLGAWYTPLAVLIALIAWVATGEAIRFLAVLVIATPCPLLIAIPVAIIGSISLSARCGILIKNPVVLEQLDQCKTIIFDKTGTLTYGKPVLTDQIVFDSRDPKEILQMAASIEHYSKHPLSSAIVEKAQEEKLSLLDVKHVSEPKGEGLRGRIDGTEIILTSRKQLDRLGLKDKLSLLPKGIGLECIVLINGQLAAYYRFHDMPREEGSSFIGHLSSNHNIERILLVSGDREEEVKYMADTMGIKEVYASQSPEEKVAIVEKERAKAKTAYLGDGINDAPALVVSTVGIAFGQNSDVTAEAAGAVVMDNSLRTVDEFLHISRRMRVIALQSALGGIFLSLAGMIIAAFGYLPPVAGAIAQEVIDVIVILNALRTAWRPKHFIDMP